MQVFLTKLGFEVETCADAGSAFDLIQQSPGRFAVAVVDLTLPDMGGDKLSLRLREIDPQLRILLCSGYLIDLEAIPEDQRACYGALQKPFVPSMLTQAVEELLRR